MVSRFIQFLVQVFEGLAADAEVDGQCCDGSWIELLHAIGKVAVAELTALALGHAYHFGHAVKGLQSPQLTAHAPVSCLTHHFLYYALLFVHSLVFFILLGRREDSNLRPLPTYSRKPAVAMNGKKRVENKYLNENCVLKQNRFIGTETQAAVAAEFAELAEPAVPRLPTSGQAQKAVQATLFRFCQADWYSLMNATRY